MSKNKFERMNTKYNQPEKIVKTIKSYTNKYTEKWTPERWSHEGSLNKKKKEERLNRRKIEQQRRRQYQALEKERLALVSHEEYGLF